MTYAQARALSCAEAHTVSRADGSGVRVREFAGACAVRAGVSVVPDRARRDRVPGGCAAADTIAAPVNLHQPGRGPLA